MWPSCCLAFSLVLPEKWLTGKASWFKKSKALSLRRQTRKEQSWSLTPHAIMLTRVTRMRQNTKTKPFKLPSAASTKATILCQRFHDNTRTLLILVLSERWREITGDKQQALISLNNIGTRRSSLPLKPEWSVTWLRAWKSGVGVKETAYVHS